MKAEPFLGIEIYLVHLSHFLLFSGALAILALNVPLWPVFAAAPLVGLGVLGCFMKPRSYCLLPGPFSAARTSPAKISIETNCQRIERCKN